MGVHGEPGVWREKMVPTDTLVDKMLEFILQDLPFKRGDEVCVLVNGAGSTTNMELLIANRRTLRCWQRMASSTNASLITSSPRRKWPAFPSA